MKICLKACRINAKLNRKQFAEKLNVSESTIFNWENGKTEPTLNNLRKISEICDIPIDYISTD